MLSNLIIYFCLSFVGVNLRSLTAEQASHEMSKPCDKVSMRAQYCAHKYTKAVNMHHCDCVYVRCLYDYTAEKEGELTFKRVGACFIFLHKLTKLLTGVGMGGCVIRKNTYL